MNKIRRIAKRNIKNIDNVLLRVPGYNSLRPQLRTAIEYLKLRRAPEVQHYIDNYGILHPQINRVMFDSFWGRKISCNPYAIYRSMVKDVRFSDFTFVWVSNSNDNLPDDVKNEPRTICVSYETKKYAEELLRCGTIITNTTVPGYFTKHPEQRFATTWHGIPLKTLGRESDKRLVVTANTHRNFNIANSIVMAGPYATEFTVINGYHAAISKENVAEIGSPRIDLSINSDPAKILNNLGINNGKKVILYAPTWRGPLDGVSNDINLQLDAIRTLENSFGQDYVIYVSLHHLTAHALKSSPTNVRLVPQDIDINMFMSAVSILVSDYSSILVDFLALDRPVVAYVPDLIQYEDERGLYISLDSLPISIAKNTEELAEAVRKKVRPSELPQLPFVKEKILPHEDGNASIRAVNFIFSDPKPEPPSKVRVLFYGGGLQHNGITSALISLLDGLDYSKYDVFLAVDGYALDKHPAHRDKLNRLPKAVNVIVRNGRIGLKRHERSAYAAYSAGKIENLDRSIISEIFLRENRRIFGDQQFDIAIDYSGYSTFWNGLITYSSARRRIAYQHNDLWAEFRNRQKKHVGLKSIFFNYLELDAVVSVSPELMEVNRRNLEAAGYPAKLWTSAKNLISPETIRKNASRPLSINLSSGHHILTDPDVFKFVHIGRFSPEKNHARLIRSFSEAVSTGIDAALFLVGSGPDFERTKNLVAKLGLSTRVIFCGQISNPMPLLKMADAFVLSSNYEGQPIVLLEAMTLGKTCISTKLPSTISMLGEGRGILVDKSVKSLTRGMLKAHAEKSHASRPSFSPEKYVAGAISEFYEVLDC